DGRETIERNRPEEGASRARDGGQRREKERRDERPRLEGRRQYAVALRPDLEDLGGIDRQERPGAAEDDGQEIERHAPEDHLVAPHEGEALAHGEQAGRPALGGVAG